MKIFDNKCNQYICDANEVVHFKLIRQLSDLESSNGFFHPDMCHQIFGEKEQIFGYIGLRIEVLFSASCLHAFLKISYLKKINPSESEGVTPDNILNKMKEALPSNFYTNLDDFSSKIVNENKFRPHGHIINSYTRDVKDCSSPKIFEIYKCDMNDPYFREYHHKMECFIMWFIDAASYIDVDDDKWDYYVEFEKVIDNGITSYNFVGYSTCYRFYAYPDKYRPRISQVLILPPYQRQGHCSSLIRAIYQEYVPQTAVLDITAEDPSENFQRVRDYVDVKNCSSLPEFHPDKLSSSFSSAMFLAARKNFKINKKQARRVYEILRLQHTNENDDAEFTKYRLAIKSRINQPMQDLRRKCMVIAQNPNLLPSLDERRTILQREFERCLEEYHRVISRLERA